MAVESAFAVPLVDQDTGAVLDRDLVGSLDLVERDPEGRLVVVDLKTAARKYSDLQVEASLQLSVYSYATAMNGLADQEDLRLRFDVLTKTKQPELHRYWTQRDRAANPAALPPGGRGPRARSRPGVSPHPGLALPGLPVPEPVLGVDLSAGATGGTPMTTLGRLTTWATLKARIEAADRAAARGAPGEALRLLLAESEESDSQLAHGATSRWPGCYARAARPVNEGPGRGRGSDGATPDEPYDGRRQRGARPTTARTTIPPGRDGPT